MIEVDARPAITRQIMRGTARHLLASGYAVVSEMVLANGRRADLVGLSPQGQLLIVEVKSGIEDFRADSKWPEYREFCDTFSFAVGPEFPQERLPETAGLIVADAFGGLILREAEVIPLSAARRKAMLIAFAQLAAGRLQALVDPRIEA
ncbi:MAG: MmcB family DNA repair protein [Bosea sp. (in: a-proteobacteria)]